MTASPPAEYALHSDRFVVSARRESPPLPRWAEIHRPEPRQRNMDAAQARLQSDQAVAPDAAAVQALIDHAHGAIDRASKAGLRSVTNPLAKLRNPPTDAQANAVYGRLATEGFTVTRRESSDARAWGIVAAVIEW